MTSIVGIHFAALLLRSASGRDGRYLAAVCSTGVEIVDMQSSTVVGGRGLVVFTCGRTVLFNRHLALL